MKEQLRAAVLPAVAISTLAFTGCSDDKEDTKIDESLNQDLLVGEWEVTELNGQDIGQGNYDEDGYAYKLTFEFQSDGDWNWCGQGYKRGEGAYGSEECYLGDWEFAAASTVGMTYDDGEDRYEWELVISSLTADRIEGDLNTKECDSPGPCTDADGDGTYSIILEKN